jgi:predicted DNA-binding protein
MDKLYYFSIPCANLLHKVKKRSKIRQIKEVEMAKKRPEPDNKSVATRLPIETYRRIERLSLKTGIPISNMIRMGLQMYLDTQGVNIPREDFYLGAWGDESRFDVDSDSQDEILARTAAAS